jgi:hypothetical protein
LVANKSTEALLEWENQLIVEIEEGIAQITAP